jgi:hypothetical protein
MPAEGRPGRQVARNDYSCDRPRRRCDENTYSLGSTVRERPPLSRAAQQTEVFVLATQHFGSGTAEPVECCGVQR